MRSHQTTIHPRSPGSLVTGSPDHRPIEPQVTGLPWSLGHWVIGLLGHSKLIHPSITTIGSIYPRVMTTKPLIHPDQGQMATHLSRVTGSGSPSIHPSIHPSMVMVTRAIHPDHKPSIHPRCQGHRPQNHRPGSPSIQGHRP